MNTKALEDFAEERKRKILEVLGREGKVHTSKLSKELGVSQATVRTYLRDLERTKSLIRTHGGAIPRTRTGFELDSSQRELENVEGKRRIASAAFELIEPGDTLILDTGTTTSELARCIAENDGKNVTVVTNDIRIAGMLEFCRHVQVVLMGGVLRRGFHCTLGALGEEGFSHLAVDKAFMGANSFSMERGATTPDIGHGETKRRMMGMANQVMLLCDGGKIGGASFARFATVEEINTLVTDAIEDEPRRALEDRGVNVVVAGKEE